MQDDLTAVLERFESKVYRIPGGCWIWTAFTLPGGYGHLRVWGKTFNSSRLSWLLYRGEIPDGLHVLHNCPGGDDPACVNPDHLWLGTHLQNQMDKARKGRGRTGKMPYGVVRHGKRFVAQTYFGGKTIYLGVYGSAEEASHVALRARAENHGEPVVPRLHCGLAGRMRQLER